MKKLKIFFAEATTIVMIVMLHGIIPIIFVEFFLRPLVEKYEYIIEKKFLGDFIVFTTAHYSVFAIIFMAILSKLIILAIELKTDIRFKYLHVSDL